MINQNPNWDILVVRVQDAVLGAEPDEIGERAVMAMLRTLHAMGFGIAPPSESTWRADSIAACLSTGDPEARGY